MDGLPSVAEVPLPSSPSAENGLTSPSISQIIKPESISSPQSELDQEVEDLQKPELESEEILEDSTAVNTETSIAAPIPHIPASIPNADEIPRPEPEDSSEATPTAASTNAPINVDHGLPNAPSPTINHIPSRDSHRPKTPGSPLSANSSTHRRSLTLSRGNNSVSVVLISSALDIIAASKDAKRSAPLKESTQKALELIRSNVGGDHPREIFEPLRLACETRNEKLMIASLDCISKLISYSFFAESLASATSEYNSPPNSPGRAPSPDQNPPSIVDLVAHTITACHTETTPDPVSLQIVKALLSLVLSPTVLVHHSSLLKAVRTVYNVFLLSTDPVNQMVAQGGLTQMVHHVFTRCRIGDYPQPLDSAGLSRSPSQVSFASPKHVPFVIPPPRTPINDTNGRHTPEGSVKEDSYTPPQHVGRSPSEDGSTNGASYREDDEESRPRTPKAFV